MEKLDNVLFEQKLGQVKKQPSEKDRMRLLKNVAENFALTATQAYSFCAECHDSGSRIDAAVMFYQQDCIEDKKEFVDLSCDKLFKYDEDKQEFCGKIEVDYVPKEEQASGSGTQVNKFDKHSVRGYTV